MPGTIHNGDSPGSTTVTLFDTDPGIDDAFALALALASPEVNLRYVTTVAGNTGIRAVTRNAALLLSLMGADADVVLARGAGVPVAGPVRNARDFHGSDGLGGHQRSLLDAGLKAHRVRADAVRLIIEAAARHGPALNIIAVGPLSNVALALRLAPDVMRSIGRLVIMGGAIRVAGNVTAAAEFNFFADPVAAAEVIAAGLTTTVVPLDATQQVRCTPKAIQQAFGYRSDLYARAMRDFADQAFKRQARGFALHDPLAVAAAIMPEVVRTERVPLQVVTGPGIAAGMSLEDARTFDTAVSEGTLTDIAFGVDTNAVLELFEARVLRFGSRRRSRHHSNASRVVVVGGANMDLVVKSTALPKAGETISGGDLAQVPGGKGANQAVAAARAGAAVALIGRVGEDAFARDLCAALAADKIDLKHLRADRRPSGVALITVAADGANQISVAPGANARVTTNDVRLARDTIADSNVLLTQFESPMPAVLAALSLAGSTSTMTVLNPSPLRDVPVTMPKLVDVLVLNEVEADAMAGHPTRSVRDAKVALSILTGLGYQSVVLTLGGEGVVWNEGERIRHSPAHSVDVIDTTAAGDTFAGYLAAALARGAHLAKAIEEANLAAALSVQRFGAQPAIPSARQVKAAARNLNKNR